MNEQEKDFALINSLDVGYISLSSYGEYVNLETNLLGNGQDKDWRIFCKDDKGGLYLILADYLPNTTNIASNIGLSQIGTYGVYEPEGDGEQREIFLKKLQDRELWKKLVLGENTNIAKYENIEVLGALDIEIWTKAWNEISGHTDKLFVNNISNSNKYTISKFENDFYSVIADLSNTNEYKSQNNTLFWSDKSSNGKESCYGYVLSSPCAFFNGIMLVSCTGFVSRIISIL